jgi:hypothetical protein
VGRRAARAAIEKSLENPWKILGHRVLDAASAKNPFVFNNQKFAVPNFHKTIFGGNGRYQALRREKNPDSRFLQLWAGVGFGRAGGATSSHPAILPPIRIFRKRMFARPDDRLAA